MNVMTNPACRSYWFAFAFAAAIVLGFALRLYCLGSSSLWLNEIMHAHAVSQETWTGMFAYDLAEMPNHTPSNDIMLRLLGLDGCSPDWAWRFLSMAFGGASVLLIGLLARLMFGPAVCVAAAFVLACAPFHVAASQEVGDYGQLVFVCLAAVLWYIRCIERGAFWRWFLCALLITATLYSYLIAVTLCCWLAVFAVLLWAVHKCPPRRAVAAMLAVGTGGLLYAPWFLLVGRRTQSLVGGNWAEPGIGNMVRLVAPALGSGGAVPAIFILGLAIIGAVYLVSTHTRWAVFVIGWASTIFAIMALFWANGTIIRGNYVFSAYSAMVLLNAAGLVAIARMVQSVWRSRAGTAAAVCVVGALVAIESVPGLRTLADTRHKEPWRQLAAHLQDNLEEGDIVVCTPPWSHFCMQFYDRRHGGTLPLYDWKEMMAIPADEERRIRAGGGVVWYCGRGDMPDDPRARGIDLAGHAAFTLEESTKTAVFADAAQAAVDRGGESDLVLKRRAIALIDAERSAEAIELLEDRLLRPVPDAWADLWAILGTAYVREGRIPAAESAYLTYAGRVHNVDRAYWEYRAVAVYSTAGRFKEAIERGLAFRAKWPGYPLIYHVLGKCYESQHEWAQAYECFQTFAELQPDNAYALYRCAVYHMRRGRLPEAETMLRRAIGLEPRLQPMMYAALSETVLRYGVRETGDARLVVLLSDVVIDCGNRPEAVRVLTEGHKHCPDDPMIAARLELIRGEDLLCRD